MQTPFVQPLNLAGSSIVESQADDMRQRVTAFDWSTTVLGPSNAWPQTLHTVVSTVLDCGFPMTVLWGPQLVQIYNNAHRDLMGDKHPAGLGQPTRDCWPEVWHINEPIYTRVWQGETVSFEDALYPITRHGTLEQAFFTLCYSPLRDEAGAVAGVLVTVFETTARLRAAAEREAALHASEERVRLATDAAELGIWDWNVAGDQVVWENNQPYTLFGLPHSAEPVNASRFLATFVHPDDAPAFSQAVAATAKTGEPFLFEGRIRRTDGIVRWVAFTGRRQTGNDATLRVLGTAADITERKLVEVALRESEDRYRTLFTAIDVGFCIIEMLFDDAGTPVDYRFMETNPAFEHQTGITSAVSRSMREIAPQHEHHWFEIYGRVARTGEPVRFENRAAQLGRFYDVYAFRVGKPAEHKVAVLFNDITERKQAALQLAAAAARDQYLVRLADALRPLSDAVVIERTAMRVLGEHLGASRVAYFEVDGEDYVAERYYSNGVDSPTGRFPSTSFGLEQLATYQAGCSVIDRDVVGNPKLTLAEQEVYAAYHIAAHVGVPLVKDGRFVAGLVVHQTTPRAWTADEVALIEETAERTWAAIERARAEGRLQELYAQEQAARKAAEEALRLKDEFLATVSHELRTPLTALLGYSELLLRRQRDADYVTRTVEKMVQSAKAQAAIVEDLLDMSRIVSGKLRIQPTPLNLINVVHAAVDTILPSMEARQQTIQLALDPAAGAVFGDANRLQQVVWNLLSNAVKFSPVGETIVIELVRVGDEAQLSVRDRGKGIEQTFLPYVFDRFRQADSTSQRAHGGLGLGLAIVKHLVELHGGYVGVMSGGVNRGATFTMRLPLANALEHAEERRATDASPAQDGLLPLRGLCILVVDDQPTVLELLEELLVSDGATVQPCFSARAALAMLDQWQPDVLVSDIAMPNEDGYWLIEQVRHRPAAAGGMLPAVALTAYVRIDDRLRVLAAGFQQYLIKPIEADELRAVILSVVRSE